MPEYKTEVQKLSELLKDAILTGDLRPGERLPQRKLAERYGATTIVVREALFALERDGLVTIAPKWGATVVEITEKKLRGRYIIREALEGMAARLAASAIGPALGEDLRAIADECDDRLGRDDVSAESKARLHYRLHEMIAGSTDCDELVEALDRLYLHTIIISNAYHINWHQYDPGEHRTLVEALLSKDEERAERTMRAHVRRGYHMELAALQATDV